MWACSISLLIYLTIIRMKMRQRLAIPAPRNSCTRFLQDFCIMWWCASCALCQVRASASLCSALEESDL